ncbi:tryptophan--tRNA ligase [Candidatus Uhrbacteria bacterium]|nr:tryptophan--tRNA ligase [Candidatus Uhrbacteria bacterium]
MTIVSGIQPSGRLHVGNELGAVRNWLALQGEKKNRCFFFIADWHSLTEEYDPAGKAAQVRELAAELFASGIDPKRVTLFRQSDLPEHLELAWYFACVTQVGSMERMTQYKDKVSRGESPNVGLFTYPVLMAADILAYSSPFSTTFKSGAQIDEMRSRGARSEPNRSDLRRGSTGANDEPEGAAGREAGSARSQTAPPDRDVRAALGVPVGDDQKQHLELANDIVRRFNHRYGETFPEVKYLPAPTARVMSLKDPFHKMSKSLGGDHCLFLDDSPEEIARKLRSAVTDTGPGKSEEGRVKRENVSMSPGVRTLFEILEAFGDSNEVARFRTAHDAGAIKYSELKPAVAHAFAAAHDEFRTKKADLMAHPDRIDAALERGAKAARAVAGATLAAVRRAVGIRS